MKQARKGVVVTALAALGIVVGGTAVVPAQAATRTTLVYAMVNALTSLNSGTPDTNLVTNSLVGYMTGSGFTYYDNKKNLIANKRFGTFKLTKNTAKDFRVTATVNKGQVWSDGTPITGVDLLLSHVLSSGAYSKAAGLGDPTDAEKTPTFNSLGYGGDYDLHVVGEPTLSKDGMSVTVKFDQPLPDWELLVPGPAPVHAMVHLANGKTGLQPAAANLAAKAAFLKAFKAKDNALLSKMGKVWSESYNINQIDDTTNKLLLISNGGFIVQSAVAKQSVTMVRNAKYVGGPKFTGNLQKVVLTFIEDPTAAAQALSNGEIDLYDGALTADSVAQFKAIPTAKVVGANLATYEHVDLRIGSGQGEPDDYTGPFASSNNATKNQRAKDLRTAALLAWPRQEIVDKLIKPINADAVVLNSGFVLPDDAAYAKVIAANGSAKYMAGTQDQRTADALKLVQKYYPEASATNPVVKIRVLHSLSARRVSEGQLVKAALAKAGFDVTDEGNGRWSSLLDKNIYDAMFFAWSQSAVSQNGTNANYKSDGSNNHIGYNNPAVDEIFLSMATPLTRKQAIDKYIAAEKLIIGDAVTLGLFQWPGAVPYNKLLKNVKPSGLSPNYLWNYWELGY